MLTGVKKANIIKAVAILEINLAPPPPSLPPVNESGLTIPRKIVIDNWNII